MVVANSKLLEQRIGFIGAGNMAQSLIGGLLAQGISANQLFASDPAKACRDAVALKGVTLFEDNAQLISSVDVVLVAVKPQVMVDVLKPLSDSVKKHAPLIISIAAGVTSASMIDWLQHNAAIVRCMPNTPSLLREGATGLYASSCVSVQQKEVAQALLAAVGLALWVDNEEQLDAVTAVSGSGPAYFFLMLELMVAKGVALGLDQATAKRLAEQTSLGAAKMAIESDIDLQELRRRVTSPAGTTEAAINTFIEQDFSKLVDNALQAAYDRSKSLAKELS